MNGSWDQWVNYHKKVAGMLRALDGPLFSMAGLQPPHLIIACMLEPVHARHAVQRVCRVQQHVQLCYAMQMAMQHAVLHAAI